MKTILVLSIALIQNSFATPPTMSQQAHQDENFSYVTQTGLAKPLLIIAGKKGFLACGYINPEACNKTGEACAIVSGVNTTEDMEKAEIKAVSKAAEKLGIKVGMKGKEALQLLK